MPDDIRDKYPLMQSIDFVPFQPNVNPCANHQKEMNTLEDLHQRLINIGKLISEVLGLFSHVKLTKHELDIVFHNLDSGKIEEVLDDLKNVISQQRLQHEDIHDVDAKENEILPVIKQETGIEGWHKTTQVLLVFIFSCSTDIYCRYMYYTSITSHCYKNEKKKIFFHIIPLALVLVQILSASVLHAFSTSNHIFPADSSESTSPEASPELLQHQTHYKTEDNAFTEYKIYRCPMCNHQTST